jgi:hypothetical protein
MPGIPIRLRLLLPTAEPFQAVTDVGNLIAVDFRENLGGLLIAGLRLGFLSSAWRSRGWLAQKVSESVET